MALIKIDPMFVRKLSLYRVAATDTEGRDWQWKQRLNKDDPRFYDVIAEVRAAGVIDTKDWEQISGKCWKHA